MEKNFKLTPEVSKKINEISGNLPILHKIGIDGKPLLKTVTYFTGVEKQNGINYNTYKKGKELIYENHEVNLIDLYKKGGWDFCFPYVKKCMDMKFTADKVEENKTFYTKILYKIKIYFINLISKFKLALQNN